MKSKVGIGVIGCGRLARNTHLPRLSRMDQVTVVGVMDILEQPAREAAQKYNLGFWTTDLDELLAREDIDAVLVASWTHAHAEPTIKAARLASTSSARSPSLPQWKKPRR